MPRDDDLCFLRSAVESGVLAEAAAGQVRAALEKVEQLGAASTAREIAVNRGFLTQAQADTVQGASGPKEATPVRRSKRLGNFGIVEKLGVGGMGVVYKARQLSMDRLVALKVLPRRLARDSSFIARFLREARSAARLNHPHIVQGIDVGEADGLYYFAMELVDGESLRDRIRRVGRVSESEALQVARQIALALEHANAHHIIHRDVKPDNILLTRDGVAKLADLGLAKRKTDAAVTQAGAPLGTPLYMSPEQARGQNDLDTRSDIYSLGATLYHAVVGSPPFTGPNATAVITRHLFERPPSPRDAVPELTEGFCSVILKMLAKEPKARYQSPEVLLEDITRLIHGRAPLRAAPRATSTGLAAVRRTRRRRTRSPLVPIFATTAIFALIAGAWVLYDSLANATEQPRVTAPKPEPRPAYPSRARPRPTPAARRRPPPTRRPARQKPRDEGAAALESVRQWAKAHADTPAETVRRYRAVAARHPDTEAARAAEQAARKLEGGLRAEAKTALFEACHEAKRLAAGHRFARAVELLDRFGADHPESLGEVSEERGFILAGALRTERELRGQASGLAKKGDFPAAIGLYKQIMAFGIPKLTARARHEIGLLDEQLADAQRTARHKAEEACLALRLTQAPLLQARDYAEARSQLEAARADARMAPVRPALDADAADLAAVAAVWAAAEKGARSLKPREKFSVGGIRGEFVRFAKGELHVRASGLVCRKPLRELTSQEVLALAVRQMPAGEPRTSFACGLFLLAEGKAKAAAKAFAEGEKAGGDSARYVARLEQRRADEVEAEANALFARIEQLGREEKWKQAGSALHALEQRYGRTRSFGRHRGKVEELALQARLATLGVTDLFHGKCRLAGNGRKVELTYDFGKPEQLADWSIRGPGWSLADPPSRGRRSPATAGEGGGKLVLSGAAAVLRAPVEHEVQVTAHVADASGPPGEWGLFAAERMDGRPAYALALPERIGLKAVLREHDRDVERGGCGAFRLNQARKVALAVRPRRVAVAIDGKDVLTWTDENGRRLKRVHVGFGSQRERTMHVSSVRVVAAVDEQWASDELERLRVRLHKRHELERKPWRSLFNGVSLEPWRPEHGNWQVKDGAATTEFGGNLVLHEGECENLELRLKVRPLRAKACVRVSFRVSRNGECYGLSLGAQPDQCCLSLHGRDTTRRGGCLARFGERVAFRPERWYDVRIVAVGSEIRAELDGALLCLVRDDRRHRGTLSLDVLHGGAAFKDMQLRALD